MPQGLVSQEMCRFQCFNQHPRKAEVLSIWVFIAAAMDM